MRLVRDSILDVNFALPTALLQSFRIINCDSGMQSLNRVWPNLRRKNNTEVKKRLNNRRNSKWPDSSHNTTSSIAQLHQLLSV